MSIAIDLIVFTLSLYALQSLPFFHPLFHLLNLDSDLGLDLGGDLDLDLDLDLDPDLTSALVFFVFFLLPLSESLDEEQLRARCLLRRRLRPAPSRPTSNICPHIDTTVQHTLL